MMFLRLTLRRVLSLIIGLAVLSQLGCGGSSTPYVVGSDGYFQTKDLEAAQKEIPFKIVLPTYVPPDSNMNGLPWIKGPTKRVQIMSRPIGGVDVEVMYFGEGGQRFIALYEHNYSVPWDAKHSEELIIGGVNVRKWKGIFAEVVGGEVESRTPDNFTFENNGINYRIEIYGYPSDVEQRIVASLISN